MNQSLSILIVVIVVFLGSECQRETDASQAVAQPTPAPLGSPVKQLEKCTVPPMAKMRLTEVSKASFKDSENHAVPIQEKKFEPRQEVIMLYEPAMGTFNGSSDVRLLWVYQLLRNKRVVGYQIIAKPLTGNSAPGGEPHRIIYGCFDLTGDGAFVGVSSDEMEALRLPDWATKE